MSTYVEVTIGGADFAFTRTLDYNASPTQYPRLANVGVLRRPLSVGDAEVANVTVEISKADGALTDVLGAADDADAVFYDDGLELLSGRVTDLEIGPTISFRIVSAKLNEAPLLRLATVNQEFAYTGAIPHVLGEKVSFSPRIADSDGFIWRLADNTLARIRSVVADGRTLTIKEYELQNQTDDTGRGVAFLRLAQAASSVTVVADGPPDDEEQPIKSPYRVLKYIIDNLSPEMLGFNANHELRTLTADIELRGVINDSYSTVKTLIYDVLRSAGAVWSVGTTKLGQIWPNTSPPDYLVGVLTENIDSEAIATRVPVINQITVLYNYDWAQEQYRNAATLQAPHSIQRQKRTGDLGIRAFTLELPWQGNTAQALAIATNWLAHYAGVVYEYEWKVSANDINKYNPGDYWEIDSATLPKCDFALVVDAELDFNNMEARFKAEGQFGNAEVVDIISQGELINQLIVSARVDQAGDFTELEIRTPNGDLAIGATVLFGGIRRVTDKNGIARFPLPGGFYYRLEVYYLDFPATIIEQYQVI